MDAVLCNRNRIVYYVVHNTTVYKLKQRGHPIIADPMNFIECIIRSITDTSRVLFILMLFALTGTVSQAQHEISIAPQAGGVLDSECSESDVECPMGYGAVLDYGYSITPVFQIVAKMQGLWRSEEDYELSNTMYTVGVRVRESEGALGPWVQLLWGYSNGYFENDDIIAFSGDQFVLTPGFGFDLRAKNNVGLRLRVEFPIVNFEAPWAWRASVGVTLPFGGARP